MMLSFKSNSTTTEKNNYREMSYMFSSIVYELFSKFNQLDVVFYENNEKPKGYILKQIEGESLNDLEGIFTGICSCFYNDGYINIRCFDEDSFVTEYQFILAKVDGEKRFVLADA